LPSERSGDDISHETDISRGDCGERLGRAVVEAKEEVPSWSFAPEEDACAVAGKGAMRMENATTNAVIAGVSCIAGESKCETKKECKEQDNAVLRS
jgi:hypothetical protein